MNATLTKSGELKLNCPACGRQVISHSWSYRGASVMSKSTISSDIKCSCSAFGVVTFQADEIVKEEQE